MKRHAVILVAVVLLLAGCVGGQGGLTTGDDVATTDDADSTGDASTMNFYVSDEENAMSDFAHLNVTISKVGLKRAGDDANWTTYDVDNRTVDLTRLKGANATRLGTFPVENGSYETVFVHVSEVNGTLTNGESVRVKLPSEKLQIHQSFTVGANQSVDYVFDISVFKAGQSGKYILKPVISESGTDEEIEDVDEKETEDDAGEKAADDADEREDDGNETDEDETEEDRNETEDENETAAGDRDDDRGDDERDSENETDSAAGTLNATFVGNVTPGENATVSVTRDGNPVANATVEVEGEVVGRTNADGRITFSVPDREDLEVEIETDDDSTKLETNLRKEDDGEGNGENGNGN